MIHLPQNDELAVFSGFYDFEKSVPASAAKLLQPWLRSKTSGINQVIHAIICLSPPGSLSGPSTSFPQQAWMRRRARAPSLRSRPMSGTPDAPQHRPVQNRPTATHEQTPVPVQVSPGLKRPPAGSRSPAVPASLIRPWLFSTTSVRLLQMFYRHLNKWISADRPWLASPTKWFPSVLSFVYGIHPP